MFDLLLKNCNLVDGSGAKAYFADIAVKGDRIAEIFSHDENFEVISDSDCREIVDCQGMYLTPGFIDIHSHSDVTVFDYPMAESRILQGITTELGGNCGMSASPVSESPEKRKMLADYIGDLAFSWRSVAAYGEAVQTAAPSQNLALAVGHGTLRIAAMGFENRKPTRAEMYDMKRLLRKSLDEGAFCMTSGLIYPPGCYADTDELIELCKILPEFGAFYATHMRNEGDRLLEACSEAIRISRESGAPLQISHHKALYKQNWNSLIYKTTEMIESALSCGLDVTCDQYPYVATATSLDSNVPIWAFEGGVEAMLERLKTPEIRAKLRNEANKSHEGRWQDIFVSYVASEKNRWMVGKHILEIAQIQGKDPADACFDILIDEKSRAGEVNYAMNERDVEFVMKKPYVMISSDGYAFSFEYEGQPHPRSFGSFVRVLAHYCRDRNLFSLEEAVRKMTGMPAERLGLTDRGKIAKGFFADLVLFNLSELEDNPSYEMPKQACSGIKRVYVNGVLTALDGHHTGARSGRLLKKTRANI